MKIHVPFDSISNLRRRLRRRERAAARSRFSPDRSIDLSLRLLSFARYPSTARLRTLGALPAHSRTGSNYWLSGSANSSHVIIIMRLKPLESTIDASIGVPREMVCLLSACCDNSGHTRVNARFPREKLLTMTSASCGAVKFFFSNISTKRPPHLRWTTTWLRMRAENYNIVTSRLRILQ